MRYLVFDEPHQTGNRKIKRTEEEAIVYQREYALKKHNFTYESDTQALDDYICVNWAYWVEEL
jgi:hypothetical protein